MTNFITAETSLSSVVRILTRAFGEAGIASPEVDARFLVQGIAGVDGATLIRLPHLTAGDYAPRLRDAMARRIAHEPVSRILGWREFYGRRFEISPEVLDPRPETETLIEAALEILEQNGQHDAPVTIADVGTGSGILIATLLLELPNAQGIATDISAPALEIAKRNVEAHGIDPARIAFRLGRGLAAVDRTIDLIVANPPYIPSNDVAGLDPGVRDFDPVAALDGGGDGLNVYRELAEEIAAIANKCWLAVEIGATQADDVSMIFGGAGLRKLHQFSDLGGQIRVVTFKFN